MGRKKRKADSLEDDAVAIPPGGGPPPPNLNLPPPPPPKQERVLVKESEEAAVTDNDKPKAGGGAAAAAGVSSGYAMTTHSADIVDEDIYVSDGSSDGEEEENENEIEMLIVGSRMGIMRRGIHHQMLVQPNRQWTRSTTTDPKAPSSTGGEGGENDKEAEEKKRKAEEEELAKLDPAQRAARLLIEKQRKLEEAKEAARRLESEENAGRDPCLFSKRTAFDIRFDQIDDKPWTRSGDMTDFFNYGLMEEDWLEYAEHQLMIRQELTDASRQRRPIDPTIVPVIPTTPKLQTPKVAVVVTETNEDDPEADDESAAVVGPVLVKTEEPPKEKSEGPDREDEKMKYTDIEVGAGGAWGAGAAPGSVLAKLIEEQERQQADTKTAIPSNDFASGGSQAMDEDSPYGPGSSHADNRNNQHEQNNQDWNNQSHQNQGGYGGQQQDWDDRGSYGHQQQQWNQQNNDYRGRGGRGGGRGYYGGRGGRGGERGGGRGGYSNDYGGGRGGRSYQSGSHWQGGGGDYQQRKRPREDSRDYDNRGRR